MCFGEKKKNKSSNGFKVQGEMLLGPASHKAAQDWLCLLSHLLHHSRGLPPWGPLWFRRPFCTTPPTAVWRGRAAARSAARFALLHRWLLGEVGLPAGEASKKTAALASKAAFTKAQSTSRESSPCSRRADSGSPRAKNSRLEEGQTSEQLHPRAEG